ncbi:pdp protein [Nautilia profundicola AmH]|uniref:Pdp protein n=1 Tax=Nautilia profundicola (strain ATCC BAA-1463 / DSM 18972 / AmH) TaxID=598659 RepID=B9L7H5_NAUPA|nr:MotE family protein [Nautilia profundicola]ACM93315.1 pdp protein [Nautilia profundicola AmH]
MKNIKLWLIILPVFLFAVDQQKLLDCYEIFDQKRAELEAQAEKLLEKQEAFEALKNTYMALMKKKEEKLKKQQDEINATLAKIEDEKKQIEALIKKNQQILADIKKAKLDKITQSYAKMRPNNAAQILSNMKPKDALEILQKLQPKVMAKILAKMDPMKAATLTQMMQNGENNASTNTPNR